MTRYSHTFNFILQHISNPNKAFFHNKSKSTIILWQFILERIYWFKIKDRVNIAKNININNLKIKVPKKRGFLILPKESLKPEIKNVIEETDKIIKNYIHKRKHQDTFLTRHGVKTKQHFDGLLLRKSLDDLTLESAFIKLALHPELIECISEYLGQVPRLNTIEVWYSRYIPNPGSSTLFHTDAEYSKQAKFFIYGNDVLNTDNGPFNLYDIKDSSKAMKHFKYLSNKSIDTSDLNCLLGEKSLVSIQGKKGTAFIADTSNIFHSGSLIKDDKSYRITIMFHYLPYLSNKKLYDFSHLISKKHTPIQKFILDSKKIKFSLFKGNKY